MKRFKLTRDWFIFLLLSFQLYRPFPDGEKKNTSTNHIRYVTHALMQHIKLLVQTGSFSLLALIMNMYPLSPPVGKT